MPTTDPTTSGGGDTTGSEESSTTATVWFDLPVADLPIEECAGETIAAEQKLEGARIVFVVDNSPSMYPEAAEVEQRLNDFASAIVEEGIDVRVAMLSAASVGLYNNDYVADGMCIGAPLGSGMCAEEPDPLAVAPDTNEPEYLHIDQYVNSTNAIPVIIEHQPNWGPFTAGAEVIHFVVISDSDSNQPAGYFINNFIEAEPDRAAIFHAVVPTESCAQASSIGDVYIELAALTGGVVGNLCDQDFFSVFSELRNAVVEQSQLPCEFQIPVPPEGEDFDPEQVNVEFDGGIGNQFDVGYVESEAECANVENGWYYDDAEMPTAIILCPDTCESIQGIEGASVRVILGCATIPAG